jgi:hypothetical protein
MAMACLIDRARFRHRSPCRHSEFKSGPARTATATRFRRRVRCARRADLLHGHSCHRQPYFRCTLQIKPASWRIRALRTRRGSAWSPWTIVYRGALARRAEGDDAGHRPLRAGVSVRTLRLLLPRLRHGRLRQHRFHCKKKPSPSTEKRNAMRPLYWNPSA